MTQQNEVTNVQGKGNPIQGASANPHLERLKAEMTNQDWTLTVIRAEALKAASEALEIWLNPLARVDYELAQPLDLSANSPMVDAVSLQRRNTAHLAMRGAFAAK